VGIALGAHTNPGLLPDAGAWFQIASAGVLESLLWTLLAVGVGAIFGNVIGTVITLLMYSIVVDNLVALILPGQAPGFLPNQAADGITSSLASQVYLHSVPPIPVDIRAGVVQVVQFVAGARGAFDWWISALIFLAYSAIFFGIGWASVRNRDVT
jgi:ABC-2 type transport system permease protein